jgi:hypothetical protein
MRTAIRRVATLAASIALAACSSGTTIIVRQPPPPPPPPPRVEPLEITVARPVRGHLLVQTNRPSYVALFEIVPDRGVALLAPSYAHQRTWMLAGLNWVPVSWKVQSTMYYGPPAGTAVPARWVYAIASDEPLRLPDEAFHPSYMRRVLGAAAYRGTNPYVTMRAIARAFLPSVIDESWAEDAYALAATYASDPYRTVRIYCANRTVYEVPEEMANRAWCPVRTPAGGTIVRSTPTRPDSIVATNGQRMRRRYPETTPVRAPIDRVSEPTRPPIDRVEPPRSDNSPVTTDNTGPRNDTPANDAKEKERRNNGNAYGHTDDPTVKGRGIENEKQNNGKAEKADRVKVEKEMPADVQPRDDRQPENNQPEKVEAKQEKQEEKQLRREEKQEEKAEQKVEKEEQKSQGQEVTIQPPRQETPAEKPEVKPVQKEEEPAAKPQEKQESKSEAKAEQKEEKAEVKAEEKSTGKPDEKPQDKPRIRPPGMKDPKNKP